MALTVGREVNRIIQKSFQLEFEERIEKRLTKKFEKLTSMQGIHRFEDLNKQMTSYIEDEFKRAYD